MEHELKCGLNMIRKYLVGFLNTSRFLIKLSDKNLKLVLIFSTIFESWSRHAKKVLTGVSQHVKDDDQVLC